MSAARLSAARWLARQQGAPWPWLIVPLVLLLAVLIGRQASPRTLVLVAMVPAALLLLRRPPLGLAALVIAALLGHMEIGTGTEVMLNLATLLVPALLAIWLIVMLRRGQIRLAPSRTNLPLALFLLEGLLALLIGIVIWDPAVPRSGHFALVQLAQWAIFAFSALAYWLTANLVRDEIWLQRLTTAFLVLAGTVAVAYLVPVLRGPVGRFTTIAFTRAPLWVLLAALAGGQLLFNRQISSTLRILLVAVSGSVVAYAFVQERASASNWVGVAAVAGVLIWLRFPRLRLPIVAVVLVLAVAGLLFPALYNFAGGDPEWTYSGQPRLILIRRVIDVTMRNPITGLGPAAYRPYASMQPLVTGANRLWVGAVVSSHNNYVDLFAHTGLVGLALFGWFVVEIAYLGYRLRRRYRANFAAGYVNGVLAAGVGALAIMVLADWVLPFVYNIGFPGFQASVLMWLFMGGLVALERMSRSANQHISASPSSYDVGEQAGQS